MELPNVETLSAADKVWFAQAIAGMIVADGKVDESEMNFLRQAIGFLEDRDEVARMMNIVKQGKPPQLEAAGIESRQAFIMLKYLSELMVADSRLSTGEIRFFLYAGTLLGFTRGILTKLWKTARSQLERRKPKAIVSVGNLEAEVVLIELSESRFTFRFPLALTPNAKIILRMHKDGSGTWDPVACRMLGQSKDKYDGGSFSIHAKFEQKLAESHGVLQILNPDQFLGNEGIVLKPKKNSLMGRMVRCFVCDEKRVPHYVLRSRSMITEPNIFGVPAYIKSAGKLEFCDYNMIQVHTCPTCGFSSNSIEFYGKQKTDQPPFDVEAFREGWEEAIQPLLETTRNNKDAYFTEDRSVEMALLSYDMGRATFQRLADISIDEQTRINLLRKMASMLLFQAELLMENQRRSQAEANLKQVVDTFEPVFEIMEGESILRVALLIFQIKIYFKDYQSAGQYMKFLDNYDTEGKLDTASSEYKTLQVCSAKLKKFFDDREILSRDNLSRFHVED